MAFLLDTCAVSELVAIRPNPHAVEVIVNLPDEEWFLSAMTVGEIRRGIDEMDPGKRQRFLEEWFSGHIRGIYAPKTIPFDSDIATTWGAMTARLQELHLPMQMQDSVIAATAYHNGLTVVTRNVSDFKNAGVPILNPWK